MGVVEKVKRHFYSLRFRLILLVLLTLLPLSGVLGYEVWEEHQQAVLEARADVTGLAGAFSHQQEHLLQDSKSLLSALARLPEVRSLDEAACNARLAELLPAYSQYANLGVIGLDGYVRCSVIPFQKPLYAGDRGYFQRALQNDDFAAGDYQVGRITALPVLVFAYPVRDDAGQTIAVVFGAVNVRWMESLLHISDLSPGTTVTVLDRHTTVLAHFPDSGEWVGKTVPDSPLFAAIRDRQGEGVLEAPGLDGVPRLYAFTSVSVTEGGPDLYLALGVLLDTAYAEAERLQRISLASLGLALLLGLAASWAIGEHSIVRRIHVLGQAAQRLAAGDLTARSGLPGGLSEIRQLAGHFDDMAQALQARLAERDRAEEELLRLRQAVESSGEVVFMTDREGIITYINPEFTRLYGHPAEEVVGRVAPRILKSGLMKPEDYEWFWQEILNKQVVKGELVNKTKDGRFVTIEGSASPILDEHGNIIGFLAIQRDITERKRAEEALRESEANLNRAQSVAHTGSWRLDIRRDILSWSAETYRIFGVPAGTPLTYGSFLTCVHPEDREFVDRSWQAALQGVPYDIEHRIVVNDQVKWIRERAEFELDANGLVRGGIGTVQDITERKRVEEERVRLLQETHQRAEELEALAEVASAMRTARTVDEMLPLFVRKAAEAVGGVAGSIFLVEPETGDLVSRGWLAASDGWRFTSDASLALRHRPGEGVTGHVAATGEICITRDLPHDPVAVFLPGEVERLRAIRGGISLPLRTQEHIVGVLHIWRHEDRGFADAEVRLLTSITEMAGNALHRAALHEQTEQRLQRLTALRAVDTAITASPDLHLTLDVLLNQVTAQLRVDAADILLLNPHSERLEHAAGRGFRTAALQATRLRLGEGYAGRAALERRIVHIPDLRTRHTDFLRSPLFATEAFISTYCVPLIAKGQVMGVLELFHRAPLVPDPEWLNFLESLAVQAAIAIDNAELFDGLRRSNVELGLAYDATLEGWARALELRDEGTEGHTVRVTEMAVRLARAMGLTEEELVHLRRGALLHDIGKIGVPDRVLLKPGPLTDDEWGIMRNHPIYANGMLMQIAFLHPALDIPFCHHEKWDGTGYPRGLKGEQIPLAARIFAVADVWDALRSDRPYRPAWPEEKVREHIREQSGKHFDPRVVEVFMRMVVGS